MKRHSFIVIFVIFGIFTKDSYALSVNTHMEINRYILTNAALIDSALNNYNFGNGVNTPFPSNQEGVPPDEVKYIKTYIINGGSSEDNFPRWGNHYHNPLRDWLNSGYQGFDLWKIPSPIDEYLKTVYVSAPRWVQQEDQNSVTVLGIHVMKDNRSWPAARNYLYNALTATDEDARNSNFVECFTSVGQVMHLIQDMSVPAHVRDDSHECSSFPRRRESRDFC